MHVAVLGAGVVGVTTAYYLAREGCSVTLIDGADAVASGASGANGGQLSYSFADPLGKPGLLRALPGFALGRDPAVRMNDWLSGTFLTWSASLLAQCSTSRARANTAAVLALASRSQALLGELQDEVNLEFGYQKAGKLVLLSSEAELMASESSLALKRRHGCTVSCVTLQEAIEIEPSVADFSEPYAGAVYSRDDAVGDARRFTQCLSQWLVDSGDVTLKLGAQVERLLVDSGHFVAVQTAQGNVEADAVVVCLGARSNTILNPLGLAQPVYPMRGYSLTLPIGSSAPRVSVTSSRHRMVLSRFEDRLRVAGFADFVGFKDHDDAARIQQLLDVARSIAPQAADYSVDNVQGWAGNRPMTPNSRPLTGATAVPGVHQNIGHGMLGWTLACATAADTAASVISRMKRR